MDAKNFKQSLLNKLYEKAPNCTACPLGLAGRTNIVFGEGNPDATLMFVGEGPGRDEDKQGRPFVGRSGKLLDKAMELVGINRKDVFIANIVKCRPPENRLPTPDESKTCKRLWPQQQIKIIRPSIICTLGSHSLKELTEKEFKITKARGIPIKCDDYTIIPTLHPAYVLRNPKALENLVDDLRQARQKS